MVHPITLFSNFAAYNFNQGQIHAYVAGRWVQKFVSNIMSSLSWAPLCLQSPWYFPYLQAFYSALAVLWPGCWCFIYPTVQCTSPKCFHLCRQMVRRWRDQNINRGSLHSLGATAACIKAVSSPSTEMWALESSSCLCFRWCQCHHHRIAQGLRSKRHREDKYGDVRKLPSQSQGRTRGLLSGVLSIITSVHFWFQTSLNPS